MLKLSQKVKVYIFLLVFLSALVFIINWFYYPMFVVDYNLKKITETNISSNAYDIINNHRTEYDRILKCGKPALNYMLQKLDSSLNKNSNGLNEMILSIACSEILGGDNYSNNKQITSGLEWYKKYKQSSN